mgnify:CR=1 FL=1
MKSCCLSRIVSVLVFLSGTVGAALAQSTPQSSYQGSLEKNGQAVNGNCDFQFGLWSAASGGVQIAPMQPVNAVSVTDGVFTGFRTVEAAKGSFIQFSAPLNPGNSGGPLVDESGAVVGVVSLKFLSQQGMPVSGVGFAVPSAQIKEEYGTYLEK